MASSLEELLAEEGFKAGRRVTRSRSSFHHRPLTEPLYSFEEQPRRHSVSSEGRTKPDPSRYEVRSRLSKTDAAMNNRPEDRIDERLKNEAEQKPCSNSSEYMPRYERQESRSRVRQVSNAKRGKGKNSDELGEKERWGEVPVKDEKVVGMPSSRTSTIHMPGNLSATRKNIKPRENSYTRSTSYSKNFEDSSSNKNHVHDIIQSASNLALDQVAVQAVVSILNGYIKRFLKDEDFRSTMRHNCFSSLNFTTELEQDNNTETKVRTSLEQAIETIEQTAEQSVSSSTYLKRAAMQLSIITGLSLNDLKHGYTCGIPNYKLSASAHLYLSVVYMIQRKNKLSAKHLLQVFCDSPYQARMILLPELWEHLFSPQLSHLKAWYNKEAEILVDIPIRTRKLKLLQKVYNEHLDSGTHIFAVYYKDWLTEGVESPTFPSIGIPSIQKGSSSLGHSSESASSSTEPFSPQPMVSKKLYDSVFGSSRKTGMYEAEDDNDEDNLEVLVRGGSYSSTIVKQTLTYESETSKFTDQDIQVFTQTSPVDAFHQNGTSVTAVEEWKERNLGANINKSFSIQTNFDDALLLKANELTLRKPNNIKSALEEPYFPSIPQEFICPLTGTVLEEPVTLETGQTFEREAIKAWFAKGNKTCPATEITLECLAMPLTNLILKRVIDNWKSESLNHLLDFASQTVEKSKELKLRNRDEAAVFKLDSFLSSMNEECKSTYAKHLISLGVLSFLFRRFELGNVQEKSQVVALLLLCIETDNRCIYQIAGSVNIKCLLELLHSKEFIPITNAILLLTEILTMKRRKDVTSFISGLADEDLFNTLRIMLMHLEKSTPHGKPLAAVLLLHFDLLVEPQKFRIYREVAVNAIAVALDASLHDDKARTKCCQALLILCGHFSSNGKILTKTSSILKEAGFSNCNSGQVHEEEEEDGLVLPWDLTFLSEEEEGGGEEERDEELLMNLLESLIGDGESPFLKNLCRCLDSRDLDLVRACLISVTWLSSSLSILLNARLHLPAFLAIISRLKGILENGELELKTLASLSLLNFSKISECRTLLKTMAQDIGPLLHRLAHVTWTAKHLHAILSGENL